MPSPRPPYLPGHFYHFFNRGAHRRSIFKEPQNYIFVLNKIKKYLHQLDLSMIAYCLMPNHYHLLIRQDADQSAGLLPARVFNSYTKAYNTLYHHTGTLFEGNYRVRSVSSGTYLTHLCRYIHGNPVKHGFVNDPAKWQYSNYLEFTGERSGSLYDPEFVKDNFSSPETYHSFVFDDLTSQSLSEEIKKHITTLEQ